MKNSPTPVCIIFNKPYGVLSQFTPGSHPGTYRTLKEFGPFPENIYPAGRLDADSEGLLFLTDDNALAHRLTEPRFGHARTYLVQVERVPDEVALERLQGGTILIEGRSVLPAEVRLLPSSPVLHPRPVPIRYRKNVPTAWLEITLREGRNRQVRRMTAAAGHPTLRLIRTRLGGLTLDGLSPGQWRRLSDEETRELQAESRGASILVDSVRRERRPGRSGR